MKTSRLSEIDIANYAPIPRDERLAKSLLGKCHCIVMEASSRVIEAQNIAAAETWQRVS